MMDHLDAASRGYGSCYITRLSYHVQHELDVDPNEQRSRTPTVSRDENGSPSSKCERELGECGGGKVFKMAFPLVHDLKYVI